MLKAVKKHGKMIHAYRLGSPSSVLDQLIRERKLIHRPDGSFEVLSREAVAGGSGHGEIAHAGDYIKIDSEGFPYPNSASFFEERHVRLNCEDDTYEQIPAPVAAWTAAEPVSEEIKYLQDKKGLSINQSDENRYFTAPLWGTIETAPADAVIVFYSIDRDRQGKIINADFNFVIREEFERQYEILPS